MPRSLILAGPTTSLASGSSAHLLLLPHPRTSAPAYFLPQEAKADSDVPAGMLELHAVKPEGAGRSWFIRPLEGDATAEGEALVGQGSVIEDSALHLLAPIDPVFLLLPICASLTSKDASLFLTTEDLFERASTSLYRSRAQAHNAHLASVAAKGKSKEVVQKVEEEGEWKDIVKFGALECARRALGRICEVQEITPTLSAYRLSPSKVTALLQSKVARLSSAEVFAGAPGSLGRSLARSIDVGAPAEEEQAARLEIAKSAVKGYLSEEWSAKLDAAYTKKTKSKKSV